ncbi:hypothetical protein [Novosphingobium sp. TH158]|uniref:hypothetical protein n=1 Tax=Novosphingobium sp. TH158 TaxID=2067455 RepID=UPI000C7C7E22|nr:hypothetical protein [Novosphingobium sp. TH158]PLK24409.1 hypothetical protein C0V78_14255 [Novosphingobium sp. TH158]
MLSFSYSFGGIAIISEFPLTRLRSPLPHGQPFGQIAIETGRGPAPDEDERLFDWPGRFEIKLGRTGTELRFETPAGIILATADGSRLRVFAQDLANSLLGDLLARRILPRVTKLLGGETYHAAALARNGKAILLMGATGAGKSSMTLGLASVGGWSILSDDAALVQETPSFLALPAGSDVAIWPETSGAMDLPDPALRALTGYDGKFCYQPEPSGSVPTGTAHPQIAGIFFLDRQADGAVAFERLPRPQAFELGLHQIVLLNPNGRAAAERVGSVTALNRMLATVPAWSLTYPASYSIYQDISSGLDALLAA